jgi:hypothetical protein
MIEFASKFSSLANPSVAYLAPSYVAAAYSLDSVNIDQFLQPIQMLVYSNADGSLLSRIANCDADLVRLGSRLTWKNTLDTLCKPSTKPAHAIMDLQTFCKHLNYVRPICNNEKQFTIVVIWSCLMPKHSDSFANEVAALLGKHSNYQLIIVNYEFGLKAILEK